MTSVESADKGILRPASEDEAEFLTELALRSKGYWEYESDFLRDCRSDLAVTPEYISKNKVVVVERDGSAIGFYSLAQLSETDIELVHLFVEPQEIGFGYGRQLFRDAIENAKGLGYQSFLIKSDPYAAGFYTAMGATRIGEVKSAIRPLRSLPLLRFILSVIF